ncbi:MULTISPECIES: hypothetical protein [unclassified Microbacterium]|uniref:hypothetical protein n=1 Tax=unclassified Microbacterium TaxID=2609290 RepID=UPI00109CADE5|nr:MULTISPECIES: hypothetical protein [unclassified Microbacterium]
MSDFVDLFAKRNRGWPWPERSFGLTPMYGEDGWCHACGVPSRQQQGSLILQQRGLTVSGAWMPNWRFDTLCMARDVAEEVSSRFDIETREVKWARSSPGDAVQIVIPSTTEKWFEGEALAANAIGLHGKAGAVCGTCGIWRWMPLWWGKLPPLVDTSILGGYDIVASPEWFGAGWKAFRQVLVRRELAEALATASPRDFAVKEVSELTAGVAGAGQQQSDVPRRSVSVPAGAVSEVFGAELLTASAVQGAPSPDARRAAEHARAMLQRSNGQASADALAEVARTMFDGGEIAEALSLWQQAEAHGSVAAHRALRSIGYGESDR